MWESPTPGLRHLSLRDHPDGFTVLPVSVAGLLPAGVVALDLADPPVIDTQLVWRPDDAPPAVHRLVTTARAVCT